MNINLIRSSGNGTYLDCFDEIENSLKNINEININVKVSNSNAIKRVIVENLPPKCFTYFQSIRKKKISLSMGMGWDIRNLFPQILLNEFNFLYLFDAWPRFHEKIFQLCRKFDIKIIFFSSSKAAELFNKRYKSILAVWIPEGIRFEDYRFLDYDKKSIDVLEFGRKYELYHNKIKNPLLKHSYRHLSETIKGEVIFDTREDCLF